MYVRITKKETDAGTARCEMVREMGRTCGVVQMRVRAERGGESYEVTGGAGRERAMVVIVCPFTGGAGALRRWPAGGGGAGRYGELVVR